MATQATSTVLLVPKLDTAALKALMDQALPSIGRESGKRLGDGIFDGITNAFACFKPVIPLLTEASKAGDDFHGVMMKVSSSWENTMKIGSVFSSQLGTFSCEIGTATESSGKFQGILSSLKGGAIELGTALAGMALQGIIGHFLDLKEHAEKLDKATQSLGISTLDSSKHMDSISSSAMNAGGTLNNYVKNVDEILEEHIKLNDSIRATFGEIQEDSAVLDGYIRVIGRLAGQSNLTAQDQVDLMNAIEGYNKITGDSVGIIDIQNGMLSQGRDAILNHAAAWQEEAQVQALQDSHIKKTREMQKAEAALAEAQQKLQDIEDSYNSALTTYTTNYAVNHNSQLRAQREKVDELTVAYNACSNDLQTINNQQAKLVSSTGRSTEALGGFIGSQHDLSAAMKEASIDVDGANKALSYLGIGVTDLSTLSDAQLMELYASFDGNFESILKKAIEFSDSLPEETAARLSSGSVAIDAAMESGFVAPAAEKLKAMTKEAVEAGVQMPQTLASNISAGEGSVTSACGSLVDAGTQTLRGRTSFFHTEGNNHAQGYGGGLASNAAIRLIAANAANLVSTAINTVRNKQLSASPAKVPMKEGKYFGQGYAIGIENETDGVARAASGMVDAALAEVAGAPDISLGVSLEGDVGIPRSVVASSNSQNTNLLAAILAYLTGALPDDVADAFAPLLARGKGSPMFTDLNRISQMGVA